MVYGLFVNGKICITGNDAELLHAVAPSDAQHQVVLMVSPTGDERDYYSINAYVAECGDVTPVDVSMAFGLSLGAAIKRLAVLESKGYLQSRIEHGAFGKQVRHYTPRVA